MRQVNRGGNQGWRPYASESRRMRLWLTAEDWRVVDEYASELGWQHRTDSGAVEMILKDWCERQRRAALLVQSSFIGPDELRR